MGNALRFLYGSCCKPTTTAESGYYDHDHGHSRPTTATASSVSSLTHHLFHFDITLQVPEGLSQHVAASKKAQAIWFRRLVKAWKDSKPPPSTPEQAASLVILTLNSTVQNANIKGLLVFYGLPIPHSLNEIPIEGPALLPEGIEFELRTLPVDAKAIADGDGMTVYVSASDSRESSLLPSHVLEAAVQRSDARAAKHYNKADKLLRTIRDSGYEVLNEEMLVRKYRIRLRGIDAPENEQPYGKEAKQELTRLIGGKSVRILVYEEDQFGRSVGDVYCNGKFVQKAMLKKGLAWHFTRYDKRPELAKWEREAREKRIGLWALSNPEKPWEWRKRNPRKDV